MSNGVADNASIYSLPDIQHVPAVPHMPVPVPGTLDAHDYAEQGAASLFTNGGSDVVAPAYTTHSAAPTVVSGSSDAWDAVVEEFMTRDVKKVDDWDDDIDTLLVFAGLFSAIVTAFIIEFYKVLQPDPQDTTNKILVNISAQLADIATLMRQESSPNVVMPSPATLPIGAISASAIWINCLWFSSLVFALVSASLGTLVKQWLRRYIAKDYSSARERTRLREHRYYSLIRWVIPHIITILPVLLRIALNLFFAGLIVLLRTLDTTLTIVVAILVGSWALVYITTSVLPSLSPDCPYASPEALAFSFFLHLVRAGIHQWRYYSWADRESACKWDTNLDTRALVTADRTFSDLFLEKSIVECAKDLPPQDTMQFISDCFRHRLRVPEKSHLRWGMNQSWQFSRVTRRASTAFLHIALDASERLLLSKSSQGSDVFHTQLYSFIDFISDIILNNHWQISDSVKPQIVRFFRDVFALEEIETLGGVQANQVFHGIVSILCSHRELKLDIEELALVTPQLVNRVNALAACPLTEKAPLHPVAVCGVVLSLMSMRAPRHGKRVADLTPVNPEDMTVFLESYTAEISSHAREIEPSTFDDHWARPSPKINRLLLPRALPPGASPVQYLMDLANQCTMDMSLLPGYDVQLNRLGSALEEYRTVVDKIKSGLGASP
ncbi:hypothetical protein PHLGIDRAFT_392025 [Phlebiopsis gigantea 11061_1 CR5-6]|uniref:DUF6535 domain-containing protein n=1 Tax=Phlebiopsis gigantea (strain 11061_1 CR5-6) TaxID=745531 RepID=A0A0C3S006_PHLG1|nr:hypothetical protein PHLGIDRAFT_392025 [Phlebiopsis gigantea 11061_1 CR5-6]